jgi:hypothetical protein
MGTHAVLHHGETRQAVYVHFDGYPHYMKPILSGSYGTPETAEALFTYAKDGDLRVLRSYLPSGGDQYHGEIAFHYPEDVVSAARKAFCDYVYTWDGKAWTGETWDGKAWTGIRW